LTCGRLDTDAGSDACNNHLGDSQVLQIFVEIGSSECTPGPLRNRVVLRLPIELGSELSPPGRTLCTVARLFRATGKAWRRNA
jgi:hypothetical protein